MVGGIAACAPVTENNAEPGGVAPTPTYTPLEDVEWAYVHDASFVSWEVWDSEALETDWRSGVVMGMSFHPDLEAVDWSGDWSDAGVFSPRIGDVDPDRWRGSLGFMWLMPQGEHDHIRARCDPEFGVDTFYGQVSNVTAGFTADATYLGEIEWKYGPVMPTWEIELNLYEVQYTDPNGVDRVAPHVGPIVGLSGTKCYDRDGD